MTTSTTKKSAKAANPKRGGKKATGAKATDAATAKTPAKTTVKKTPAKPAKKLSALDAAAKLLAEVGTPMTAKEIIETLAARKMWTSPGGKTPEATLYAAIAREIAKKEAESRFQKVDRGQFAIHPSQTNSK